MLKRYSGLAFDLFDSQMSERTSTRRADGKRVLPTQSRHVSESFQIGGRIGHEHLAVSRDHCNVGEVTQRVIGDIGIDRGAGEQRPGAANQYGVAVSQGAADLTGGNRAGATGNIFHIELLPERVRQFRSQHACE